MDHTTVTNTLFSFEMFHNDMKMID